MKFITFLILAFGTLSHATFTIPGNINVRPIEIYKNQICQQNCNNGILSMSFMQTGETSGEKKCPGKADLTLSCSGYLCAGDGKNCAVTCENNNGCSKGFSCEDRKCVPEKAISYFCSNDRTVNSSKGEAWDCSPLICQAGRCKERCATTNDCVPGSVCDTSNGSCVYVH